MTMKVKVNTKELKFRIPIIVKPDTIGYHSYSPALKGLHMDGDTEAEALENARLTAIDFLRIMIEEGIPIPISTLVYDKEPGKATIAEPGYYEEDLIISLQ